jgi:DNA-binding protein H-NS
LTGRPTHKPHAVSVPKFRKGRLTWDGRGQPPQWVIDVVEAGGALADYRVTPVVVRTHKKKDSK